MNLSIHIFCCIEGGSVQYAVAKHIFFKIILSEIPHNRLDNEVTNDGKVGTPKKIKQSPKTRRSNEGIEPTPIKGSKLKQY